MENHPDKLRHDNSPNPEYCDYLNASKDYACTRPIQIQVRKPRTWLRQSRPFMWPLSG